MRKVAVVDDNADNRLIIRTILEDQYEVMEFSNGIEAIDGFRKDKPDIVILDISLPEMDGTEILRRIRDDSELHDLFQLFNAGCLVRDLLVRLTCRVQRDSGSRATQTPIGQFAFPV